MSLSSAPALYLLISPCRNEAEHMRRTLDSVVAQSSPPALWVIVDDGSTDGTLARLRSHAARDGRLRVDGTQEDHDHALCRGCGTVFDVDRSCYPLPQAPRCLPRGLDVVSVRVEYDVICSRCGDGEPGTDQTTV